MAYIEQNGKLVWQDTPSTPAPTGQNVAPTPPVAPTTTKLNTTTGLLEKVPVEVPKSLPAEKITSASSIAPVTPAPTQADPFMASMKQYQSEWEKIQQAAGVNPYEQKVNDLTTQYEAKLAQPVDRAGALQTAYDKAGVTEQQKQLADLNLKIAQTAASYDKGLVNAEGQIIPMQFITGQQALIQKQKAVDVGAMTAMQQAMSGNLDLARQTAKEAVNLEFEDRQQEIDNLKQSLSLNYDRLNAEEKKRADKMNYMLESRQAALDEEKKLKSEVNSVLLDAVKMGADQTTQNAIRNAKTVGDAISIASKYLAPAENMSGDWSTFEDADGNTMLYDKNTGTIKPTSSTESKASFTDANGTVWNIEGWATDPSKAQQMQMIADRIGKVDDSNIDAKVKQFAPGLTADMIRSTSSSTGVSWEALLAMANQESGGGTSNVAKNNNNFAGLTWNNQEWVKAYGGTKGTARPASEGGNYIKFPTKQAGLDAMGALMAKYGTVDKATTAAPISNAAKNWADLINQGKAKLETVPTKERAEVVKALAAAGNVSQADASITSSLTDKVSKIDDLISKVSTAGSGVIGPTWLARWSTGNTLTGKEQAFVGDVKQLVAKETMDVLLNLKKAGGTLGALSDQERIMLQNAATKISNWEKKDKNGVGKGVWAISEKEFKKELENIKKLTQRALEQAGGSTGVVNSLEQNLASNPAKIDEYNKIVAANPNLTDDEINQVLGF
jgi:hypothetical protein